MQLLKRYVISLICSVAGLLRQWRSSRTVRRPRPPRRRARRLRCRALRSRTFRFPM